MEARRVFAVISALIGLGLVCGGCGKDEGKEKKGSSTQSGRRAAQCKKVMKRNLQCLDVLVPLAQRQSQKMLAEAVAKVPEPQRVQLRAQIKKTMAVQRGELKKTLRHALKKPFLNWCRRAAEDPDQKKIFARTVRCLEQPDCQTYAG